MVKLHQLPTLFQVNFEVCFKKFRNYCAHIAQLSTHPAVSHYLYFAVMFQVPWHTTDGN